MNRILCSYILYVVIFSFTYAQTPGTVLAYQKISATQGNFTGVLRNEDYFGISVANIGDLDDDGIQDIAVGARFDDDGGVGKGALWILFLNKDGTVKNHQKISDTQGGFTDALANYDCLGISVANIGDLDDDGIQDIAVAGHGDDDGGSDIGAVWILFLNKDGTVKGQQKISATQGGFTGALSNGDQFGKGLANIGDLDGDEVMDLLVGAPSDNDGGTDKGAVWILFLNTDGTVKDQQKISDTEGNFTGALDNSDYFGLGVSSIGDLDDDGVIDIVVGAVGDDDGYADKGAIWILFLNTDGTVKSHQKISDTRGNFTAPVDYYGNFGISLANMDDLDDDGIQDIAVGAHAAGDGGVNRGAVWILFLKTNGKVKGYQKISATRGNFAGTLDDYDYFGRSVANIGDLDGDGKQDIAVGANEDDDGGTDIGAVWILNLFSQGDAYINEIDNKPGLINIYPNPTQGILTIESAARQDWLVEMISITGRVIYEGQIKASGDSKRIDLSKYSRGIYLLKLTNGEESILEKVVYIE